jgi:hypothetical protein
MTSVTLNWLVYGEDPYENAFQVEIAPSKSISALKEAIRKNISESVTAKALKLFKVDIPLGETRDNNAVLICKIGELSSIGLEMKDNLQKISYYFNEKLADRSIHILVQIPTAATGESKILVNARDIA